VADAIVRRKDEVKFAFGKEQIALSFVVEEEAARWGYLEQRVTLDRDRLEGEPTGYLNLLRAANLINATLPGLRCVITQDRLRFRREVYLERDHSLAPDELGHHCRSLLRSWAQVFQPLREVQAGSPGEAALGDLRVPSSDPDALQALVDLLTRTDRPLEPLSGDRLALGVGEEQIVLSATPGEIHALFLLRPWSPPAAELEALRHRRRAPQVEDLLIELNGKNRHSLYALAWEPSRGVLARAVLAEASPDLERVLGFLGALEDLRRGESVLSIDGG
jgi:hypothetical protein